MFPIKRVQSDFTIIADVVDVESQQIENTKDSSNKTGKNCLLTKRVIAPKRTPKRMKNSQLSLTLTYIDVPIT